MRTRGFLRTALLAIIVLQNIPCQAETAKPKAATRQKNPLMKDEEEIPTAPTSPPSLGQEVPTDLYPCKRKFVYQGRTLTCDSNLERDAERLRAVMTDVPSAVSEIDDYQRTRRRVKRLAYTATAGIAMFLTGRIITSVFMPQSQGLSKVQGTEGYNVATTTVIGDPNSDQETVRNQIRRYTLIGGLGLAGASLITAVVLLGESEARIGAAVNLFNQAHPDRPIELQFSTGFSF